MPARRSLGDLLLQQMSRRAHPKNPRPSPAIQKIGGIDHRGFSFPGREGMSSRLAARRTAIIICPARSIENMRLKPEWKRGLSESRLLILSIFPSKFRRSTLELARQRNKFVAALADRIFVAHAAEGVERWNLQRWSRNGTNPYSPLTQNRTNRFSD